MASEIIGSRAATKHSNPSHFPRSDRVPGIIARRAPFLAGAIALDMISTNLSINSGSMEIGPGSLLFANLSNTDPANTFSPASVMFHGSELLTAAGMAYGLGHMWGDRKSNNFAAKWFMNGAIGILGIVGLNNMWDAAYLHGIIPVAGPLDQLLNLGLEGLLNVLDHFDPPVPAK